MPLELWADNAATTLTSSPGVAATSFTVTSSTGFPAAVTGVSQFRVIIGTEIVTVTNVSGTTWTCVATAASHTSGDAVTHVVTAASMAAAQNGHAPVQYEVFPSGSTSIWTLTPLTAGTVESVNLPATRILADLSGATQMRLIIGQRVIGAGGTTCAARLQYATNGATQTTWADANNTGTGISLLTGTANTLRDAGWVDLVAGARIDSCYLRFVVVTTGTVTTAPTISKAEVTFR